MGAGETVFGGVATVVMPSFYRNIGDTLAFRV